MGSICLRDCFWCSIVSLRTMASAQQVCLTKLDGGVYHIAINDKTTGHCIKRQMQEQVSCCACRQRIFLKTYEVKDQDLIKKLCSEGNTSLNYVLLAPNVTLDATQLKVQKFNACCLPGVSASEMKAKGFTAGELVRAGRSFVELKEAHFSSAVLRNAGATANQLHQAGFGLRELHAVYSNV